MKKILFAAAVLLVSVSACDNAGDKDKKTADVSANSGVAAETGKPKFMTSAERIAAFDKKFEEIKSRIPEYAKGVLKVKTTSGKTEEFQIEIAETPVQQAFGLMLRKNVPQGTGMIFVMDEVKPVEFWMKNTLVPLDMLFIAEDKKIVTIKKNAVPLSEERITSGVPVKAVLEIVGGEADRLGIKEGDTVDWEIKK